jgi:TolB-like protein/tetratricopeptide (TPR) repeat protein
VAQTVFNRFWNFWRELKRRRVVHATGLYVAACWLILQVFDVILMQIGTPQWVMELSVWLAIVGFPIMLVASWHYEVSRDGFRHTPPATRATGADLSIKPLDYLVISLMVVFLVFVSGSLARILKTDTPELASIQAEPDSIAVLPFENLGGQVQDEYLGRGLAEDILHRLAMIKGLHVASRTAAFKLDTSNLDIPTIGQRLGVTFLLEGSVRKEGNRLRIVAQLIDTESGYHIWSRSYEREMDDLFGIYDEISTAVVSELQLSLNTESVLVAGPPTSDMQAYDYFLQARSMMQRTTRAESIANAQRFFAKAVERDPGFAEAWAGQCQALLVWYYYRPEVEKIEQAQASCIKALELNPDLAEGHAALGDLYRKTGRFDEAINEYELALKVDNRHAVAWRGFGQALAELEREGEAEDALSRALELDPDDLVSFSALGGYYFSRARYPQAVVVYGRMAEHPSAGASAHNSQGAAYYMMGEFELAARSYRQVVAAEPSAAAYSNIGIMYFYNGQLEDAAIMYREAIALAPENPVWWGNLGDSLLEIDGGHQEALMAYQKAADLAEVLLPANPEDAELLTNLAHYHARLGDDERASKYLARALFAAPDDYYAHYYAALVHLEADRQQEALEEIRRAVALGYPKVLLAPDPQFVELHSNESFLGLIE